MKAEQLLYSGGQFIGTATLGTSAQWVLVFGTRELLQNNALIDNIRNLYPMAYHMGCSTSGEIFDENVDENTLSITAVAFEKSRIEFTSFEVSPHNSYETGQKIISSIDAADLKHIFVLSEGLNVNGSQLVEGMKSVFEANIPITGGLAGDGTDFSATCLLDNGYAKPNLVVLAAIYGDIRTGCASVGGWDTFGIERVATKTENNILYELDGKPALDLYKEYLGDKSAELPASALLFPLNVRTKDATEGYVRTILAVDEEQKSLIFAGDIPLNSYCKLMKSNSNNLIKGSLNASSLSAEMLGDHPAQLAILVSCVGRRLVLKQRVDEELEVVRESIGDQAIMTGFYSYGEISPYRMNTACELHNQTMTITLMSEE